MIQYEPLGYEGFGYDPVFYLPSYSLTMAQISLDEKNRISHRAGAAGKAGGGTAKPTSKSPLRSLVNEAKSILASASSAVN